MTRILAALFAALAIGCAADGGQIEGQAQNLTGDHAAQSPRSLASTIPTRVAPRAKVKELSETLAAEQRPSTGEELAKSYSFLQDVGSPTCAYTEPCGSGGGNYSGCVFGYCAWCQTWALCHFEDGSPNYDELAICDPGPCRKP